MEGNACRSLLHKAHELYNCLPDNLQPYATCLVKLDAVVSGCFGSQLHPEFRKRIADFGLAYDKLPLSISPKVHVLLHHVPALCSATGHALGSVSEQAFEAVHHDFHHVWQRYTMPVQHPKYAHALLQAVVAYNSFHV